MSGHKKFFSRQPRVLVVDDDRLSRLMICETFGEENYQVIEAINGMQALEVGAEHHPDIVLLDAVMPVMNGFDACYQIRESSWGENVPVLMITSLDDKESIELAFAAGADDYINKPVNWMVLKQRVRRLLSSRETETALRISEELHKNIFSQSPIGIFLFDENGELVEVNEACLKIYGIKGLSEFGRFNLFKDPYINEQAKQELLAGKTVKYQVDFDFDFFARKGYLDTNKCGIHSLEYLLTPFDYKAGEPAVYMLQVVDIDELVQIQEQLRESEEKYRYIFMASKDAVYITNSSGELIEFNQAMSDMFGYPTEDFKHLYFQDLYEEPSERVRFIEQLNISGFMKDYPINIRRKNGEIRNVLVTAVARSDDAGNILDYHGVIRDITEHKRAEDDLREIQLRYNAIYDNSHAVMLILDPNTGEVFDCNRSAAVFYGYTREEMRKKTISDINVLSPDERLDEIRKAGSRERRYFRFQHRCTDGEVRDVEVFSGPVSIRGRPLVYAIVFDITERRKAEKALASETERLAVTLRSLDDGVITIDSEGRIQLFNHAAEQISGFAAIDTIDRSLTDCFIIREETGSKKREKKMEEILLHRGEERDNETLICKNGSRKVITYSVAPTRDAGEKVTGYVLVFRDITEKRKIEARLALSQKMESIGQLAAGIAHEINTPMQYIGDNTKFLGDAFQDMIKLYMDFSNLVDENRQEIPFELLEKVIQEGKALDMDFLLEEIPRAIDQSLEGVERVSKIILAMKDFTHPGKKEKSYANLNRGIESTVNISKNEWKYVADLEVELDSSTPAIFCNLDEINQVILNMILNATHAIGDSIEAGCYQKGLIRIRTENKNQRVKITISDNGAGISPEYLSRIFDPFFTTKGVGQGTGQGLAIVHDIIENKHRGEIYVESELGKGTTFSIILPVKESDD